MVEKKMNFLLSEDFLFKVALALRVFVLSFLAFGVVGFIVGVGFVNVMFVAFPIVIHWTGFERIVLLNVTKR